MNGLWQGIYNSAEIDTDPGGDGPFAPPAGFTGDYTKFLHRRWDDPMARQQMLVTALKLKSLTFSGCWKVEAEAAVRRIAGRYCERPDAKPRYPERTKAARRVVPNVQVEQEIGQQSGLALLVE